MFAKILRFIKGLLLKCKYNETCYKVTALYLVHCLTHFSDNGGSSYLLS